MMREFYSLVYLFVFCLTMKRIGPQQNIQIIREIEYKTLYLNTHPALMHQVYKPNTWLMESILLVKKNQYQNSYHSSYFIDDVNANYEGLNFWFFNIFAQVRSLLFYSQDFTIYNGPHVICWNPRAPRIHGHAPEHTWPYGNRYNLHHRG